MSDAIPAKHLIRRGTEAQWIAANPVLELGEMGFETDTNIFRVGDGATPFMSLERFATFEQVEAAVQTALNAAATFDFATIEQARAGVNTTKSMNPALVKEAIINLTPLDPNGVPAGAIIHVATQTPPLGYLKANGSAQSREAFPQLFAAIGTTFGEGDGSTTFNLPDLRGEFVRGWNDDRSVDTGRVFGSSQLDQMQRITGNTGVSVRVRSSSSNGIGALRYSRSGNTGEGSGSNRDFGPLSFDSGLSPNARVSSTTSGETRPRNVALLACIKF